MSKGSNRRPAAVTPAEVEANWERALGKLKRSSEDERGIAIREALEADKERLNAE